MQCKDIKTEPILEFLYNRDKKGEIWATIFEGYDNSIQQCFPINTPLKLVYAKMYKLIKKGFVSGCACGCRGDFEITQEGIDFLNKNKVWKS